MNRYQIWDKTSDVFTPGIDPNVKGLTYSTAAGTARFTPAEWAARHPVPPNAVVVIAAGDYNGGFMDTLNNMVQRYSMMGADFSNASTNEEKLAAIEAFEDAQNQAAANYVSTEERTAAALELLALNTLPDADQ